MSVGIINRYGVGFANNKIIIIGESIEKGLNNIVKEELGKYLNYYHFLSFFFLFLQFGHLNGEILEICLQIVSLP